MINAHINEERAVPVWAAVGVPMLGIPLLVALLALLAPGAPAPASEEGPTMTSEHVLEVLPAERTADIRVDCTEPLLVQG